MPGCNVAVQIFRTKLMNHKPTKIRDGNQIESNRKRGGRCRLIYIRANFLDLIPS